MLRDPDAHGSMLNLPFSLQAVDQGVRNLANATDVVGPYLGFASFAMRDWARANADVVQRYLAAYVESIRFMLNPANAEPAAALLTERLRLSPEMARRNLAIVTNPRSGAAVDGRFDMEGFRNVLRIRAEMLGTWGGTPPAPDRYLDLSHWERALASL
jgi:ABC-type nitrate/sulfonate/bicarbonate transport system substrate-binding protein